VSLLSVAFTSNGDVTLVLQKARKHRVERSGVTAEFTPIRRLQLNELSRLSSRLLHAQAAALRIVAYFRASTVMSCISDHVIRLVRFGSRSVHRSM